MSKREKVTYQYTKREPNNYHEIDNIPKYFQQRRSPGSSKRRSDFSLFFSSSSSPSSLPDLILDSPSSKEILSTVTATSSDEINDTRMNTFDVALDRSNDERSDSARTLNFYPKKSLLTEKSDGCVTPSFEERSCNPVEELFASPDVPDSSNLPDQSPDKGNSSSSSRAGSENTGSGRSKRERKPIARFDEMTYPLKSIKKVRRIKIMRLLGLAAPVGSPFLSSDIVRVTSE